MMTNMVKLAQDADIAAIWGTDLHAIGCLDCGIAHLVPALYDLPHCPACLSDALEPQPARICPEPPELLVPFSDSLTQDNLRTRLVGWLRGIWLRPQDLRVEHLLTRMMRVYWPMWLVDGNLIGNWGAQMGFDYQVESSQEQFSKDVGWTSRRLTETRVRWEPRVGWLERVYHNQVVPALEASDQKRFTSRLGRYELDASVPYTPVAVSDTIVRVPNLLPAEAWPVGRSAFDHAAAVDCQRAAGAQHCDEFTLNADYRDVNWTQLLLPFFVTFYRDDAGHAVPVWINGQNGHVSGVRRASLRRGWLVAGMVGAVALAALVVGLILTIANVQGWGTMLMTGAVFFFVVALLPVLWAWQFNRRSF